MHKFTFPSKFIPVSSSVIIVRRSLLKAPCDYEILLLKRNPKISFGNYYAFPGGMIETQDKAEHWRADLP